MTPTARHCDVIFPTTTPFEKEDVGIPWVGNWLLYKPQVVPPVGQARSDYDALWELADRMGFGQEYSEGRTAMEWVQRFIDQSEIVDPVEFRRTGIYLAPDQERVGLAEFAADPAHHPLSTPSGKVEIASDKYHDETGFPAIPTWQAPPEDERYPLRLITPKSPHRTHSQGSNIPELRARDPHALSMHAQDAASRGIANGDTVHLSNAQGTMRVSVRLSEDLLPGVVSLPEGIWVALDAQGVDIGGAANMFTATEGTDPGVACIMHAVPVQVSHIRS
jgi:anaerobic selenocysteine-containing dehydrogenase